MTRTTEVKYRQILFAAEMVRAILDGRKTQTRRVAKPPEKAVFLPDDSWKNDADEPGTAYLDDRSGRLRITCPYGKPGDRLWVRETWGLGLMPPPEYVGPLDPIEKSPVYYRADWPDRDDEPILPGPWRPSIHMPRWASRITLEVESVRVERLREITEEDAKTEGVRWKVRTDPPVTFLPSSVFQQNWDRRYAKRGLGWAANPWVWVVGFQRVEG